MCLLVGVFLLKVIFGPVFLEHDNPAHPENKGRLSLILEELGEWDVVDPEDGEQYLGLCHSEEYVQRIRSLAGSGFLTPDTYYNEHTFRAACYAVGAAVQAARLNAFALVRPPGHHALRERGGGFCIFNSMAVAAKVLSGEGKRIAILDIDCHHGNGTQELVKDDRNILYCSLHQSPLYPGTGLRDEGNALNAPLPAGSGDKEGIRVSEEKFFPAIEDFNPDVVGVSAGFDAYYKDKRPELGNDLNFTLEFYERVAEFLRSYDRFLVLEGGYDPVSILECSKVFLEGL